MAITKTGTMIFSRLGLEKTALFGSKPPPPQPPSAWKKIGGGFGRVFNAAMPGFMAFGSAHSIASGADSVGGSLGGLGGGLAGMSLGGKAFNALAKNMKPGKLKFGLDMLSQMVGSTIGDSVGHAVGGAVLPFRRKPQNAANYWQNDGYGWSGQPE